MICGVGLGFGVEGLGLLGLYNLGLRIQCWRF